MSFHSERVQVLAHRTEIQTHIRELIYWICKVRNNSWNKFKNEWIFKKNIPVAEKEAKITIPVSFDVQKFLPL